MSHVSVLLQEGGLNSTDVLDWLKHVPHGAQLFFLGVVRHKNDGREVLKINFDIHKALAIQTMQKIAEEAIAESGDEDTRIYISHAYGDVVVGETCISIGVSSYHRDAAYVANRYVIEALKSRVPIWKQEHYTDQIEKWLPGHDLTA